MFRSWKWTGTCSNMFQYYISKVFMYCELLLDWQLWIIHVTSWCTCTLHMYTTLFACWFQQECSASTRSPSLTAPPPSSSSSRRPWNIREAASFSTSCGHVRQVWRHVYDVISVYDTFCDDSFHSDVTRYAVHVVAHAKNSLQQSCMHLVSNLHVHVFNS